MTINFADLCELIEMAVLYERIIITAPFVPPEVTLPESMVPGLIGSPLEVMMAEGIITSPIIEGVIPSNDESGIVRWSR